MSAAVATALKVFAVIAALAIAAVAVQQNRDESESRSPTQVSGSTTSDAGFGDPTPTPEPEPEPTGLAGIWWSSEGGGIEFVEAGAGRYRAQAKDACGETGTVEFSGGGNSYSATGPLYEVSGGSCGDVLGQVRTTITIGADGDTASVTREMTSAVNDRVSCYTCDPFTLTRAS